MVEFAGYELPVQYSAGPMAEHHAVRTAAGLFDIDHMGQFELRGPDSEIFLERIQTWDVSTMQVGDAHYSLLLYDDGTIVDDIFIYRLRDRWFIVVNAANREKDMAWIAAHTFGCDATLIDVSGETYMMALQGPKAVAILEPLSSAPLADMAPRTAREVDLVGVRSVVGRTGYTGEDGFEIYADQDGAEELWDRILEAGGGEGLLPCGLAARDSLRFEACMPLYGHEISASINPLEARLGWTISWDRRFTGRDALLKVKLEGPQRLLVGFEMVDKAVPREHYPVTADGVEVGFVTTGMKSPTLDKFLGMAYVPPALSKPGSEFDVLVRGAPKRARVVKRPFYKAKK